MDAVQDLLDGGWAEITVFNPEEQAKDQMPFRVILRRRKGRTSDYDEYNSYFYRIKLFDHKTVPKNAVNSLIERYSLDSGLVLYAYDTSTNIKWEEAGWYTKYLDEYGFRSDIIEEIAMPIATSSLVEKFPVFYNKE
jgi:hypothetical protein